MSSKTPFKVVLAGGRQDQGEEEAREGWAGGSGSGDPLAASAEGQEAAGSEPLHCTILEGPQCEGAPWSCASFMLSIGTLPIPQTLLSPPLLIDAPFSTLKPEGPLVGPSSIGLYIHLIRLAFWKICFLKPQRQDGCSFGRLRHYQVIPARCS